MKIGEVLKLNQEEVYNNLSKAKYKKHGVKTKKSRKDKLTFSDIEKLMRHDSHVRGTGGSIRQKTWGR